MLSSKSPDNKSPVDVVDTTYPVTVPVPAAELPVVPGEPPTNRLEHACGITALKAVPLIDTATEVTVAEVKDDDILNFSRQVPSCIWYGTKTALLTVNPPCALVTVGAIPPL